MFNNIKYILFNFITLNKKAMKKLMLIIGIAISINVSAQYSKSYNPPKGWGSIELYLPASILVSTFTINQSIDMSLQTRNQIAVTGMCTSVLSHFIFRQIRLKKWKR